MTERVWIVWQRTGEYSDRMECVLGDTAYGSKELAVAAAAAHASVASLVRDEDDPERWETPDGVRGDRRESIWVESLWLVR